MAFTQKMFADELNTVCRRFAVPEEHVHRVSLYCQRDSKFEFDTSGFWGNALYVLEYIEQMEIVDRVAGTPN